MARADLPLAPSAGRPPRWRTVARSGPVVWCTGPQARHWIHFSSRARMGGRWSTGVSTSSPVCISWEYRFSLALSSQLTGVRTGMQNT